MTADNQQPASDLTSDLRPLTSDLMPRSRHDELRVKIDEMGPVKHDGA